MEGRSFGLEIYDIVMRISDLPELKPDVFVRIET
jgi:hypothetical protein